TARRLLTARIKDKSIGFRRVPSKSPFPKLDPERAIRRIETGEEDKLLLTLAEFMRYFQLTPDETLLELQSGRLIACTNEVMRLEMELGTAVSPETIMVTYAAITDWLHHPDTPGHLIVRRDGN